MNDKKISKKTEDNNENKNPAVKEKIEEIDNVITYAKTAIKHYTTTGDNLRKEIELSKTATKKVYLKKKLKKNNQELFDVLLKHQQLENLQKNLTKKLESSGE